MERKYQDLTGESYGMLVVIGIGSKVEGRKKHWMCQCSCGNVKSVRSDSLKSGAIRSCGCLKKEQDKKNLDRQTHNLTGTRLHRVWLGMKSRCGNESLEHYERYGARGIRVCDEWSNSFEVFYEWAMSNGYEEHLTIDRIDNDGNYHPSNCKWSTAKEQANNRRSNISIVMDGKHYTLQQACSILKLPYGTISARHQRGDRGFELFKPIR